MAVTAAQVKKVVKVASGIIYSQAVSYTHLVGGKHTLESD